MALLKTMELTPKRIEVPVEKQPTVKRPRKRWKVVLKRGVTTALLLLVAWIFVAYWTSSNDCERYSAIPANPMKAVVYCDYGVTNLKVQEIDKPTPQDDQVLIRVRTA